MLSNTGVDILIEFTNQTQAIIVTRSMTKPELERLDTKLQIWKEDPTGENSAAIVNEFAIDPSDGNPY